MGKIKDGITLLEYLAEENKEEVEEEEACAAVLDEDKADAKRPADEESEPTSRDDDASE